jgi:hypothetical protein
MRLHRRQEQHLALRRLRLGDRSGRVERDQPQLAGVIESATRSVGRRLRRRWPDAGAGHVGVEAFDVKALQLR